MQSSMTNPDRRPLPEGWISHFDPRRKLWYYINLNEAPPRTTYLHPDDEDPPSPPVVNNALPPMSTIPQVSTVQRQASIQGTTPFSNASHAYRARHPTFAQQLYASATTGQNTLPTPTNSDEEFEQASTYLTNIALPSSSPAHESNLFLTSSSYGYGPNPLPESSSSLPSPPLSPLWSDPPRRRPRGARSPTFPGPLPVAGSSFTLPPVNETQVASDFRDRALFNSSPPDPTPPSMVHNPQNIITFQHGRSPTLPMKSSQPFPVGIRSKPRETPMYSTVARPLETFPNPTKTSTPAFQNLSTLTAVTSISAAPPVAFPLSANVGLPVVGALPTPVSPPFMQPVSPGLNAQNLQIQSNPQPGNTCQPITTSPVLGEARDHQEAESDRKRKVLKKVGLAVGKSAGKAALRMGTKMALGSIGIPVDTSNMFSSDGDGVLNVITEGVSEMATSAAAAGVSQVLNTATSSSAVTNTSPPQLLATISRQPTLSTASQPSINPSSYAAILNQMQSMQLQNNSSQPVYSPAEYASILSQMQAMQMPHGIQRPSPPSSSLLSHRVQQPSSQGTVSQVNGPQSPGPSQNSSAQSRWQQNLMKSVIGGATHALVSSAVDNIDFSGATDAVTPNTFSDFTASFDSTA